MKNSTIDTPAVFIGFDDRQEQAFEVCKESILRTATGPVDIYKLDHKELRRIGLFNREWTIDKDTGLYVDSVDGIKFSNQFSHTRFVVPLYARWLGYEDTAVMFVDPDFVFLDDIYKLFLEFYYSNSPVACVHHEYNPGNKTKMDGQVQTSYPKKLWSSMMIFNSEEGPTKDEINNAKTTYLHRFEWLAEDRIGRLHERWNFIPEHSEDRIGDSPIGAIHYTEGLPTMSGYENCKYSRHFRRIYDSLYPRRVR